MEYITTKEASAKWGISTTRITILANEGRIPGAHRLGKSWLIPANATKPPERKANHSGKEEKETPDFSFPLYHFRPDYNYIKKEQLSQQQQCLLLAETAVLECRFADAYPLLESILHAPDDIVTEIGCLWNAGICCIWLNRPKEFSKIYLRIQMILAEDFPYRNDLVILLDTLKTYIETMGSAAKNDVSYVDIHDQCIPLACILIGYTQLSQEIVNPGSADTNLLELNLRFLQTTGAVIAVEMMHCYLLGIYNFRQNTAAAAKHAKRVVQIAFENKLYFPLITYYRYFTSVISSVLAQYPEDFQKYCHKLASEYEKNYTSFLSSISEISTISKLTNAEYPYIYSVLLDLPNTQIADNLGVSPRTVKRRIAIICENFGVSSKKALRDYLHKYM